MAAIEGSVTIGGFIAPSDTTDTYASHVDIYGRGGMRSVADNTERDAITSDRRSEGMFVYVIDDATLYTLSGGITNDEWTEVELGGGGGYWEQVSESTSIYFVPGSGDGNVGIGTTTPNYLLDVEGSGAGARVYNTAGSTSVYLTTPAAQNASLYFGPSTDNNEGGITYRTASSSMAFTTNTSEAMRIDSSGNVGIGTTTPSSNLHISGITQTGTQVPFRIENNTGNTKFQVNSSSGDYVLQFKNAANVIKNQLHSNGASYFNGGNVGIGTTTPSAKLDVVGLANINDGSNNVMISSGNTAMAASSGANNTAVGYVAGLTNASGNNNSFFGRAAGYYSTGYNNVMLGMEAGYGSATSAYSNTVAVGYQALYDLTSGAENTAVGYRAATNLTTGNYNTAIGYQALVNPTSNNRATAIGYKAAEYAGYSDVAVGYTGWPFSAGGNSTYVGAGSGHYATGNNNVLLGFEAGYGVSGASTYSNTVAVGREALYSLTTGAGNTAVGHQSLYSNKAGLHNTATGSWSLYANDSGDSNSAFGVSALRLNETGSDNVAFGSQSLYENIAGSYNVAVGKFSLINVLGNENVGIGYNAGYSSTGSGSVFLGNKAGYNETGSNKLYIANNQTTTPLIYGEFDNNIAKVNGDLTVQNSAAGSNPTTIKGHSENVTGETIGGNQSSYSILIKDVGTKEVKELTYQEFITSLVLSGVNDIVDSGAGTEDQFQQNGVLGDLNGDGAVGAADLLIFLTQYGGSGNIFVQPRVTVDSTTSTDVNHTETYLSFNSSDCTVYAGTINTNLTTPNSIIFNSNANAYLSAYPNKYIKIHASTQAVPLLYVDVEENGEYVAAGAKITVYDSSSTLLVESYEIIRPLFLCDSGLNQALWYQADINIPISNIYDEEDAGASTIDSIKIEPYAYTLNGTGVSAEINNFQVSLHAGGQ